MFATDGETNGGESRRQAYSVAFRLSNCCIMEWLMAASRLAGLTAI
jgi:hypothetical protein